MSNEDIARIGREGLISGLIGALAAAAFLGLFDIVTGDSPLRTFAVLGAAFFYGADDPAIVSVAPQYVFPFIGAHLVAFIGFGTFTAAMARMADHGMQLWFLGLMLILLVGFPLVGAIQLLSTPMRSVVPALIVWGAALVASIPMLGYLLMAHPRIRAPQSW